MWAIDEILNWTEKELEDLKKRMWQIIELNSLEYQKKIFGEALDKPLPLAYELSTLFYSIIIQCIEDTALVKDLHAVFAPNNFELAWKVLDNTERQNLPYCALIVAYSWVRAHLVFLHYY